MEIYENINIAIFSGLWYKYMHAEFIYFKTWRNEKSSHGKKWIESYNILSAIYII